MQAKIQTLYPLAVICLALAGCGGETPESSSPGASARAAPDPCTLFTAAEIKATMGVAPGEAERPNPGINSCQWPDPESSLPVVYLGLSQQNIGSWEEYRDGMIENGLGDPDAEGERIDIGRFGYYREDAAMLQVQTDGATLITLRARGGNRAQIIDLASKAIARLR